MTIDRAKELAAKIIRYKKAFPLNLTDVPTISEVIQFALDAERAPLEAEIARLRAELEPCRPDNDPQKGEPYPSSTNDVLSLLSAYWSDVIPNCEDVPEDAVFRRWERLARPVIERLTARLRQYEGDDEPAVNCDENLFTSDSSGG